MPPLPPQASTYTLYWSEGARVADVDGTFSVVATRDLPTGTLVGLEHVISGDENLVVGSIVFDTALYATLWPRAPGGVPDDVRERMAAAGEKFKYNSFVFEPNVVLGAMTTKFNHSCAPNCHMTCVDSVGLGDDGFEVRIYGMWTVRSVASGSELTIDYMQGADRELHDAGRRQYGFACDCTDAYVAGSDRRAKVRMAMCDAFRLSRTSASFIRTHVDRYLRTSNAITVVTAQELGRHELFDRGDRLVVFKSMTPEQGGVAAARAPSEAEIARTARRVRQRVRDALKLS